jgi:hypothetical protein
MSVPGLFALAGSDLRLIAYGFSLLDDSSEADVLTRFGPSLVAIAKRTWPVLWFDNRRTCEELGYHPRPLRQAMENTIDWLRTEGHIPR